MNSLFIFIFLLASIKKNKKKTQDLLFIWFNLLPYLIFKSPRYYLGKLNGETDVVVCQVFLQTILKFKVLHFFGHWTFLVVGYEVGKASGELLLNFCIWRKFLAALQFFNHETFFIHQLHEKVRRVGVGWKWETVFI